MNEQYSPTGFNVLPTVVKNLLIINVLMFLATFTLERFHIDLTSILGLHFFKASNFRIYQFVTYMFMHANFGHLFFNMFALWMFGNTLENIWGSQRFLLFYMVCGIGAGLCQEAVQYIQYATQLANYATVNTGSQIITMSAYLNMMNTVGASGAVYGLLLAFGMMFPDSRIYLYFLFPIKAKWFVIGYAVVELITGLTGVDNVAHFAHLGGMLFGLILILYWKKHGLNGPNFDLTRWKGWFFKWKQNRTQKKQHDVDAILDKVAKNGYDSLTDEEKKFLFNNGK